MIMHRKPDGSYEEITDVKTKTGENISEIIGKNGETYFAQTFRTPLFGVPPLTLNSIGKPLEYYEIHGNTAQGVGKLVTEDEFVGGCKIPVVTSGENSESITTDIYLDEPLKTGEILKFPANVIVHADGTEETVILPEIPTFYGTTIISIDTEIQPSDMKIIYKSRR